MQLMSTNSCTYQKVSSQEILKIMCGNMCVQIHVCMYVCTHVFKCQGSTLGIFLSHSLPYFLRQDLLLNLELTYFSKPATQQDSEIALPLRPPQS